MKHIKKFTSEKINESHSSISVIKNAIESTIYDLSAEIDDYTTNESGSLTLSDTFTGEFDGTYRYDLKIIRKS